MNTNETRAAAHEQHYRTMLTILPAECDDRHGLAAVGAWRAVVGRNLTMIGKLIGHDRSWVRLRLKWLDNILKPYMDDSSC